MGIDTKNMNNRLLHFFGVFIIMCLMALPVYAQQDAPKQTVRDTTPLEQLDYHLTKKQFMEYYGMDDTSRAIINMFYRNRGAAGVVYCLVPSLSVVAGVAVVDIAVSDALRSAPTTDPNSCCAPGCVSGSIAFAKWLPVGIVIAAGGALVFPIIMSANRSIYTREKLLKTLVERERGIKPPANLLKKIWQTDFSN